jgi:hypothetical protein
MTFLLAATEVDDSRGSVHSYHVAASVQARHLPARASSQQPEAGSQKSAASSQTPAASS